jgi:DNA helicase-2/ATP-dependent DNA helicase PcrA
LLSLDFFDIDSKDLIRLTNFAKKFNLTLFEASEKVDDIFVDDETKRKITKLIEILNRHFKLVKKETAGQLLYYFLTDTGLLQKLLNPDSPDAEKKAQNISKFLTS